ncbi:MAG: hypothetical protein EON93_06325 [Burkholderiales bacterium]|nr:MAG: hypothetical protein EON93_06325 [Burkholderiales bacterium]
MIIKPLIVIHRYVGVVLGVLMTTWCLSGFVMMYQSFPATTQEERLAGLEALNLTQCCTELPAEAARGNVRIEMLNGNPVARTGGRGGQQTYDLTTGEKTGTLDEAGVRRLAETFAAGNAIDGQITKLEQIRVDQWTAQTARRSQPLWRAEFNDPGNTLVYVNASGADILSDANATERLLSWFGAIPHWLFPTVLRENQPLWYGIMTWSAAIGCFLVITGMTIGFVRLRGRSGKWWPYKRPLWMWHHMFGTFAGALVVTWTFSGLLTMQPWGLLESESTVNRGDLSSRMTWAETRPLIDQLKQQDRSDIISIRTAPFMDNPYIIATTRDGSEIRLGSEGVATVQQAELEAGLAAKGGLFAAGKLEVLTTEDEYYYGHKRDVDLPVYRLTLSDPDETRVYFDYETGEVRRFADATAKRFRWFESALHRMDLPFMRSRPVWDIVTMLLLAAVTVVCATGAWLSIKRVRQDAGRVSEFVRFRLRKKPESGHQ